MSKLLAGRYELIEIIGEGGMAVVYKAKCRLLNRYVAIKILRREYTKDAQFVESFKRESQAAAGLQHPNIINVYDVGREGEINYIVMELVDGRPLSDIIEEQGPLDYKVAIDITKQVASALSVAHKNNIIHRDIKPHNIMITKDGMAKLGDFGIAKAVSSSTIAAETSKIIGSVHYFSPEQARGSYVDERSDIYSLGIVLYEMLTGRVPFDGENPVQVALMHINDDIVPPSEYVQGIPPALEKLVMKATDRLQTNRYKSADELLEDLNNIEFVTKVVGNNIFAASQNPNGEMSDESEELSNYVEEASKKKKKKKKGKGSNKKKKVAIGVVAGIAALAVVLAVLFGTGVLGGKKGNIEVPNLKNMTYEDAESTLEGVGLKIKKGNEVPSDDVEEGRIVSQTPKKGDKVKKGKVVTVNISIGKKEGVVPNLINEKFTSKDELDKYLRGFGYVLGSVTYKESDSTPGEIIDQTPSAGKTAKKNTAIDIVVSKEKAKVKVPNLTGLTLGDAKQAIKEAGFTVGSITYGESNVYKAGYVMSQQYSSGTELDKGKSIDIVVAKEQEKPQSPKPPQQTPQDEPEHNSTDETDNNQTPEEPDHSQEQPTEPQEQPHAQQPQQPEQ